MAIDVVFKIMKIVDGQEGSYQEEFLQVRSARKYPI